MNFVPGKISDAMAARATLVAVRLVNLFLLLNSSPEYVVPKTSSFM